MNKKLPVIRRLQMVEQQLEARGIQDARVLEAMRIVPREVFVPDQLNHYAYDDSPLPIAAKQTISQPYIVAYMIEVLGLHGGEQILEVGTGSGYAAAVLGQIASEVFTIERIEELVDRAKKNLLAVGTQNVHVALGDGTKGWLERAPFDAIVVSAGGPEVPDSLKQQLRIGGRMVIPVGSSVGNQKLVRVIRRSEESFTTENIARVRFVPLIGQEGWECETSRYEIPNQTAPSSKQ